MIAPGLGLKPPEATVTLEELRQIAGIPIDARDERYRASLDRDARALAEKAGPDLSVVLLGSVASAKYVDVLLPIFGTRLRFPEAFVGRGDMSRGGLLLRCIDARTELTYVPVRGAKRHGERPPKLAPRRRRSEAD